MTDLPASQRDELVAALLPPLMTPLRTLEADRGTTRKTLWKLFDGALVESVLMRYPDRATMCVSSQAGCGMACPFCATGQGGLQRNMSTAEIVEQVVAAARSLHRGEVPGGPGRVSNVVFMGMGEPMANYKAVMGAIRRLTDPSPDGLGMSARGITVSTVGLVPRIKQLADEGIPVTLALSLHAPDDELRNELVPINTRFSVAETVDAAWSYAERTKRRVSIEYAMMRGINDQAWRADLLADVLQARGDWGWVHVNLIPLNPTPGSKWTARTRETSASSSAGSRPRASPRRSATPAAARSTGPAGSWPPRSEQDLSAGAQQALRQQLGEQLLLVDPQPARAEPPAHVVRSRASGSRCPGGFAEQVDDLRQVDHHQALARPRARCTADRSPCTMPARDHGGERVAQLVDVVLRAGRARPGLRQPGRAGAVDG